MSHRGLLRHLTWSRVGVAISVALIAFGARHHALRSPTTPASGTDTDARFPAVDRGRPGRQPSAARVGGSRVLFNKSQSASSPRATRPIPRSPRATWPPRPLSLRGWCCPTTWSEPAAWRTEDRATTVALDPPGQPVARTRRHGGGDRHRHHDRDVGFGSARNVCRSPRGSHCARSMTITRLAIRNSDGVSGWQVVGVEVGA